MEVVVEVGVWGSRGARDVFLCRDAAIGPSVHPSQFAESQSIPPSQSSVCTTLIDT